MQYNSVEHFLTVHEPDLARLVTAAYDEAGGFLAALTPEMRHNMAANAARTWAQGVRNAMLDSPGIQADARGWSANGVPLAEVARNADLINTRLLAFGRQTLGGQPELLADLERRVNYLSARFHAGIKAVELDEQLQRLTNKPGKTPPTAAS